MTAETIGRYQIRAPVGAGGFATVYHAHDPLLDRELAIKVLHAHLALEPEVRARFVHEGRALARVHHPNLVQVYDAGEVDGRVYLAMELVPGRPLDVIAGGRPLPLAEVLPVVRAVGAALDALHAAGLVHRDIKPANILRTEVGRIVLLDLGIARDLEEAPLTARSVIVGTPSYLAPEQVVGGAQVNPRTDVYQLGATVYALLSGRAPFEGDAAQVLYAAAHRAPPELAELRPDLPPHVLAAVALAMAKDPRYRPATAGAFAAALADDEPVDASGATTLPVVPAVSPPAAAARGVGRRRWPLAAAGAAAVVLAGAVVLARREGASPDAEDGTSPPIVADVAPSPSPVPAATPTPAASGAAAGLPSPSPGRTPSPPRSPSSLQLERAVFARGVNNSVSPAAPVGEATEFRQGIERIYLIGRLQGDFSGVRLSVSWRAADAPGFRPGERIIDRDLIPRTTGTFTVTLDTQQKLLPGRYTAEILVDGHSVQSLPFAITPPPVLAQPERDLADAPARSGQLTFQPPGGATFFEWTIRDDAGRELVKELGSERSRIHQLPPGTYTVLLEPGSGGAPAVFRVEVAAGKESILRLGALRLTGRQRLFSLTVVQEETGQAIIALPSIPGRTFAVPAGRYSVYGKLTAAGDEIPFERDIEVKPDTVVEVEL